MATAAPHDFAIAHEIQSSIAVSLADNNATVGSPTLLAVVLL